MSQVREKATTAWDSDFCTRYWSTKTRQSSHVPPRPGRSETTVTVIERGRDPTHLQSTSNLYDRTIVTIKKWAWTPIFHTFRNYGNAFPRYATSHIMIVLYGNKSETHAFIFINQTIEMAKKLNYLGAIFISRCPSSSAMTVSNCYFFNWALSSHFKPPGMILPEAKVGGGANSWRSKMVTCLAGYNTCTCTRNAGPTLPECSCSTRIDGHHRHSSRPASSIDSPLVHPVDVGILKLL